MAEVKFTPSPKRNATEASEQYEQRILKERQDYASMDSPENTHEVLGIVNTIDDVIEELGEVVARQRANDSATTFALEYHHSCVSHGNEPFHLFTFTLSTQHIVDGTKVRHYSFITWQAPKHDQYQAEEAQVRTFMQQQRISLFDDGSGEEPSLSPLN